MRELDCYDQLSQNRLPNMRNITGLTCGSIRQLCAMIATTLSVREQTRPPILGLFNSGVVALIYLRRNRLQAKLGETYGVSQSTVGRAVTRVTP